MAEQETVRQDGEAGTERTPVTFPYTNTPVPEPIAGIARGMGDRWDGLRNHLMTTLPPFIINNSSNVVGFEQLIAEGMLFKSNGFLLWDPANKGKWHYLIDPIINVPKAAFEKVKFKDFKFDFFKWSSYTDAVSTFLNREEAAIRDSAGGTKMLTNNMSALSGLTGMSAMAVAAVLPDHKESEEETERMAVMARENPIGYAGHRLLQAVNPIAWWDNKRQFSGLGMVGAGTFSFLSAFRQIDGDLLGHQTYRTPNWWHATGSAITTLAGVQLMFAINNQQGWSNYGTTQLARTVTLPMSVHERFKKGFSGKAENGAPWYFGGQAMMVTKNATSSLIGGGHVVNGEVIDHNAMRQDAKEKANVEHKERGKKPHTQVTGVQRESTALQESAASALMA